MLINSLRRAAGDFPSTGVLAKIITVLCLTCSRDLQDILRRPDTAMLLFRTKRRTSCGGQERQAVSHDVPPTESGMVKSGPWRSLPFSKSTYNILANDPGSLDQLASHAEVVMLDFAASMLAELERFMLTAGPAMIDLNTFCDTSDKLMSSVSVVEEVQRRLYTDEVRRWIAAAAAYGMCPLSLTLSKGV